MEAVAVNLGQMRTFYDRRQGGNTVSASPATLADERPVAGGWMCSAGHICGGLTVGNDCGGTGCLLVPVTWTKKVRFIC